MHWAKHSRVNIGGKYSLDLLPLTETPVNIKCLARKPGTGVKLDEQIIFTSLFLSIEVGSFYSRMESAIVYSCKFHVPPLLSGKSA